ncbi:MAG: hypothetical protein GX072_11995 [Lysinibacillus sp.]|nr:hypothetical protein [Lysinibacillus sp.]
MTRKALQITLLFLLTIIIAACTNSNTESDEGNTEENTATEENTTASESTGEDEEVEKNLIGDVTLSNNRGRIGDEVTLTAEKLLPDKPVKVVWVDMIGSYVIEDNYSYIGTTYEPYEIVVGEGTADSTGKWEGTFNIPDGYGDDHDILIYQDNQVVAKANYFVETVFSMSPTSGPAGTEVTVEVEGMSWKMYGSLYFINWDNNFTGMITSVTTNGKAKAVFRATGKKGLHSVTIDQSPQGFPYLSLASSALSDVMSRQNFTFEITDDKPIVTEAYVEEAPEAAGGGIKLPDPVNKDGVTVALDKSEGVVGEPVVLTASGLPKNETVKFDWHTMVGTRVTREGYGPQIFDLGEAKTDENGNLTYEFNVPDDLGGLPHLIDLKVGDEVYGQTYLRILPTIEISPTSGPVGTEFTVTIKGSGWTQFDNALTVAYDNSYIGYICGFFTQGTIQYKMIATGEPGYHFIDIVPSIYQGQQRLPDYYLRPMLTYREDHPGTGIPAIRAVFEVTE